MTCSCNTSCNCDQPYNAITQAVDDALAERIGELDQFTDSAAQSATESAASANASANSAAAAQTAEQNTLAIYQDAQELVPVILETSENIEIAAKAVEDALDTASNITVKTELYTVIGGESTITLDAALAVRSVQAIYIEGVRQERGEEFTYDSATRTVTLAEPLPVSAAGTKISLILGTINSDSGETLETTLASSQGASMIGTAAGVTVQSALNTLGTDLSALETEVAGIDKDLRVDLNSSDEGKGASLVVLESGVNLQEAQEAQEVINNHSNIMQSVYRNKYSHIRGVQRHMGKNLAWSAPDIERDKLSPTDSVFYRIPQIVKTADGTLMIFCNELHGNNTDIGATTDQQCNIVMKYSIDNGWSWSTKVMVADFGATFQNGEIAAVYNPVDGRVYCYFTSCKGQLGWGHSQPGNDPETSSQVYVTYCDAESPTIWRTPVNITATLKPATADFIWTSPTRPVVLPDGKMAMIISTVTGSRVDSFLTTMYFDIMHSMDYVLSSEDSGGEIGLNLLPDGRMVMNSRAYHTADLKGLQKFYISDHEFKNWTHLSDLVTSDSKGDLVPLFDGENGVITWAFTCTNGVNDNSIGRTNYRVWISRDLVTWGLAPVGDINTSDSVGYIASMPGGADGYVISTSESGGFGAIWFTQWNAKYIQNRNYNRYAKELREVELADEALMLSSGSIPNYSLYVNKDNTSLNFNLNGAPVKLRQLGTSQSSTLKYTATQDLGTLDVTGVDVISVGGAGVTVTIRGFSGGYIGQRLNIISESSGGGIVLTRADTAVASATNRIYYNVTGAFTGLRTDFATKVLTTLVRTHAGWFTESVANVTI